MSRFSEKLTSLPDTTRLGIRADVGPLSAALVDGGNGPALAVGSGGSAVAAAYLARCRETLFGRHTPAISPMELVLGSHLRETQVWIMSAGAENPDAVAAVEAARSRCAQSIELVTRKANGAAAAQLARYPRGRIHAVPVADAKDGFLATHSLVATITALLRASDQACPDPLGRNLMDEFERAVELVLQPSLEELNPLGGIQPADTLIIVHDTQLAAVAQLIETSAWEAALCAVQRIDLRNFAHGRHSWLHHWAEQSFLLALTTRETRDTWARLETLLPATVRRLGRELGDGGRLANAVGIIEGLLIIRKIGEAVGRDPGKPGIGEFGREMYADPSLERLGARLDPTVRHKRQAVFACDHRDGGQLELLVASRRQRLASANIGAIVLDYDGTIVPTDSRFRPPSPPILEEIVRLAGVGVRIAIATGRGGSAGEELRDALPPELHPRILVGYYNGAHIRSLAVDIVKDPPIEESAIAEAHAWLRCKPQLFSGTARGRNSKVQITCDLMDLTSPSTFMETIRDCPPVRDGRLRVDRSGHSIDIRLSDVTKGDVVTIASQGIGQNVEVLCIGDSGALGGNDRDLLSVPLGFSVDQVCGASDGCWTLLGYRAIGPDALLALLGALKPAGNGTVRVDMAALGLDS